MVILLFQLVFVIVVCVCPCVLISCFVFRLMKWSASTIGRSKSMARFGLCAQQCFFRADIKNTNSFEDTQFIQNKTNQIWFIHFNSTLPSPCAYHPCSSCISLRLMDQKYKKILCISFYFSNAIHQKATQIFSLTQYTLEYLLLNQMLISAQN